MLTKEQKESIITNLEWRIKKSERLTERASEYWEKAEKEKSRISAEVFEREATRLEYKAGMLDYYVDGAKKMLEILGYYCCEERDEEENYTDLKIEEYSYF